MLLYFVTAGLVQLHPVDSLSHTVAAAAAAVLSVSGLVRLRDCSAARNWLSVAEVTAVQTDR